MYCTSTLWNTTVCWEVCTDVITVNSTVHEDWKLWSHFSVLQIVFDTQKTDFGWSIPLKWQWHIDLFFSLCFCCRLQANIQTQTQLHAQIWGGVNPLRPETASSSSSSWSLGQSDLLSDPSVETLAERNEQQEEEPVAWTRIPQARLCSQASLEQRRIRTGPKVATWQISLRDQWGGSSSALKDKPSCGTFTWVLHCIFYVTLYFIY